MTPFIQQAVLMGYTASQVITYISKKIKGLDKGVENARNSGYSDTDMLNFLGGKIKPNNSRSAKEQLSSTGEYLKNAGILTSEEKSERTASGIKTALVAGGATALTAYTLGTMGPALGAASEIGLEVAGAAAAPVSEALATGEVLGAEAGLGAEALATGEVLGAEDGLGAGEVAGAAESLSSAVNPKAGEIIKDMNFEGMLKGMAEQGQPMESITGVLDKLMTPGQKKWLKSQTNDPIEKVVGDFLSMQSQGQQQPEQAQQQQPEPQLVSEQQLEQQPPPPPPEQIRSQLDQYTEDIRIQQEKDIERKKTLVSQELEKSKAESLKSMEPTPIKPDEKISKGADVVTQDGKLGTVKSQSGNNFLVEVDGKLKQIPMSDLRGQPEAIKNTKIVFDPSKVPEDMRSAALGISIPLPDRSAIINMFGSSGDFYMYTRKDGQPIDEDVIRKVIDGTELPITSGESFMGVWNSDKPDSRGAAASKYLKKLSQNESDEEQDPDKIYFSEKIEDKFLHGFYKEFMSSVKEASSEFKRKPPKEKVSKKIQEKPIISKEKPSKQSKDEKLLNVYDKKIESLTKRADKAAEKHMDYRDKTFHSGKKINPDKRIKEMKKGDELQEISDKLNKELFDLEVSRGKLSKEIRK